MNITEYHKIKICKKDYDFIINRTIEINEYIKFVHLSYNDWIESIGYFVDCEYVVFCLNNNVLCGGQILHNFIIGYKEKNKKLKENTYCKLPFINKYYNDYKLKKRKEKLKNLKI